MKNACIVLRNNRIPLNGQEFEGGISALLQGGYAADKVYILSQSDPHEFMQTAVECKNFFDNVLVFCEESSLAGVRAKVCEILKVEPSAASVIRADSKAFFCLPFGETGAGIVKAEVLPFLDEKYSVRHAQSVIRAVGVPTERKRTLLAQLRNMAGISVFDSERDGDLRLEILYNDDSPKMAVDEAVRLAAESLNDYTYAVDDTPLNRRIYEMLKLRGMKLSVAESFTGGGVAKKLIEVPGVSEVLFESIVAYDNGSKMRRLGVQQSTLLRSGAVSDDTAYEMAAGLIATGNCSVSLATTGIAGPASDNTNKPVGLCYIAVGTRETVFVYKYIFRGGREDITRRAINQALFLLYKQIK